MSNKPWQDRMRILVIDDEPALREAYARVFREEDAATPGAELAAELFGASDATPEPAQHFAVTFAAQGEEGIGQVESALLDGTPFKVAFIDVRMPPGIDGRETARRIRAADPDINIVIVSGYSDHSVLDIARVAGPADKLFYIAKPFAPEEVRHMARALAARWDHDTQQIGLLREKLVELAASEARARQIASHDALTGALNRNAFQEELTLRLEREGAGLILALIDLDRFKLVNDSFGHGAGDELLMRVHDALLRQAPRDAALARLGGDEFGVLFTAATLDEGLDACRRLVEATTGTFSVYGHSIQISASCGVVDCASHPGRDATDLMRYADLALFAAKRGESEPVRRFDQTLDASHQLRQQIEAGLGQAIELGELALHYQPIVEREGLTITGYEALLRWTSREHGPVSPAVFIPIAEESALIHDLGDWVVRQAFADARDWPDKLVSINFSPRQFSRPDFAARLAAQAARFGIDPARIQIEITETALFQSTDHAREVLAELRDQGFKVALDDFGTGYSTMFNLKNFAVDCIKVDRSFVSGIGHDNQSTAIINAIAYLARGLGLTIVAEGVESEEQYRMLRLAGCSHMQGFLFGKAEPPGHFDSVPLGRPASSSAA
ncbi:MAG: EAL domain-containing protein [Proteobacteria bacterium]|nr:EAL domain-containing protein [Pseudomonadota bacterium]